MTLGGWVRGLYQRTVNSPPLGTAGSNPAPPTTLKEAFNRLESAEAALGLYNIPARLGD